MKFDMVVRRSEHNRAVPHHIFETCFSFAGKSERPRGNNRYNLIQNSLVLLTC